MLEGEEDEGLRLWHLVKSSEDPEIPKHRKSSMRERERAKAIPEIYLTRLLSMKVAKTSEWNGHWINKGCASIRKTFTSYIIVHRGNVSHVAGISILLNLYQKRLHIWAPVVYICYSTGSLTDLELYLRLKWHFRLWYQSLCFNWSFTLRDFTSFVRTYFICLFILFYFTDTFSMCFYWFPRFNW